MTAPAPCAAAVEAGAEAYWKLHPYVVPWQENNNPCVAEDMRWRARRILTAALPHLRRQVIEECVAVAVATAAEYERLAAPLEIGDDPVELYVGAETGAELVAHRIRALLADAGQPKEGE